MIADLSIICTSFNKPNEQLCECMDSIKAQTIAPKEIILVDDCSNEPHAHALAISIILPKNVGVAKARDIGVKMSTGKLLLFLDADDKIAPDFIEQCGKVVNKFDVIYTNFLLFGHVERNKLMELPSKLKEKDLLKTCPLRVTSMIYRKMYDDLNGFKNLPVFEDWDFWLRAIRKKYTFKKANSLFWYRQNLKSRNHVSMEQKNKVRKQIL